MGNAVNRIYSDSSRILFATLICMGILLRLYHYILCRSLWVDEAMLALNIIQYSFYDLLKPLSYNQVAPIGFLFCTKTIALLHGNSEYALRFIPFVSGLISILIFSSLVSKILNRYAALYAMALFAFADPLIIHSTELKPYSSDVFISILLTWCFMKFDNSFYSKKKLSIMIVAGAVAIWFSFPAAFIVSSFVIIWLFNFFKQKDIRQFTMRLLLCITAWLAVFGLQLCLVYHIIHNEGMQSFWDKGFMPLPPKTLGDFRWYMDTFFQVFSDAPTRFFLPGIGGLCFVTGLISLRQKKSAYFLLLILPIVVTLLVSGFHLYPFYTRMILFLVPFFFILIAEGMEVVYRAIRSHSRLSANMFILIVLIQPFTCQLYRLMKPFHGEEIKPVLQFIDENIMEGDKIYVYYGAQPAFNYYDDRYKLSRFPVILGVSGRNDLNNYINDLMPLRGQARLWFVFSHVPDWLGINEESFYLFQLDHMGSCLKGIKSHGAAVYLYDLTQPES